MAGGVACLSRSRALVVSLFFPFHHRGSVMVCSRSLSEATPTSDPDEIPARPCAGKICKIARSGADTEDCRKANISHSIVCLNLVDKTGLVSESDMSGEGTWLI